MGALYDDSCLICFLLRDADGDTAADGLEARIHTAYVIFRDRGVNARRHEKAFYNFGLSVIGTSFYDNGLLTRVTLLFRGGRARARRAFFRFCHTVNPFCRYFSNVNNKTSIFKLEGDYWCLFPLGQQKRPLAKTLYKTEANRPPGIFFSLPF